MICALACVILAAQSASLAVAGRRRGGGADPSPVSAVTREGRLAIFDDVWETIRGRYYDPSLHGLDWQAIRALFRPRAAEARSEVEFYAVLRRMVGRLRDPHTRVYAPFEGFDWRHPRVLTVGVSVREIAGEIVVASVTRDSDAERAGVRVGDAVVEIDGEPATVILARRLEEEAGASAALTARFFAVARLFDGPRDSFVSVILRSAEARQKSVRLRRVLDSREPVFQVRRLSGRFGVVRFNAFTPEIAAEFARALRTELQGTQGLILDLRENSGGAAEVMTDIASLFLPPGMRLGRFIDREGRVRLEPQTRAALLSAADEIKSFRGPLVVLTGTKTASAAEVFVAALREERRATIVGEDTCGCVLGIRRRHTLPDGGSLDVSEVDYRTAGGLRLEGVGIAPDERVTPTRRDLRTGRDSALERAIESLKVLSRK